MEPRECCIHVGDALRLDVPEAKLSGPGVTTYLPYDAEVASLGWDHFERPSRETVKDLRGTKHTHQPGECTLTVNVRPQRSHVRLVQRVSGSSGTVTMVPQSTDVAALGVA